MHRQRHTPACRTHAAWARVFIAATGVFLHLYVCLRNAYKLNINKILQLIFLFYPLATVGYVLRAHAAVGRLLSFRVLKGTVQHFGEYAYFC